MQAAFTSNPVILSHFQLPTPGAVLDDVSFSVRGLSVAGCIGVYLEKLAAVAAVGVYSYTATPLLCLG